MTREELHRQVAGILYVEDPCLLDTMIACIVANSLRIGDPVWLTIIGPSSGGKSQLIRPMAKSNPEMFLQIDDLTSNSLISGNGEAQSTIFKIRKDTPGIISMDDLTVLFSKNAEDRNAILSQFRMIYDGRMTKATGTGKTITWEGHAGMIAGSTPAIYRHFSEVSDMGERFVSYRMRPMSDKKFLEFITRNPVAARELDGKLVDIYTTYIRELMVDIQGKPSPDLAPGVMSTILKAALVGTRLRTPVVFDDKGGFVSEYPVRELPGRVFKQLYNLAKAFVMMAGSTDGGLPKEYREALEWCAYSMADDKRREYVKSVIALERDGHKATLRNIASHSGMPKAALERGLPILTAIGVLAMKGGDENSKKDRVWTCADYDLKEMIIRLDPPRKVIEREVTDGYKEGEDVSDYVADIPDEYVEN